MICDDVKRVIYFFLDGQLGSTKNRDVTLHISICSDCEARATVQRRLRNFFRHRLARIDASERFKVRLSRSLRAFSTKSFI